MSKLRLAYAANRVIGQRGLEILLDAGWCPTVLLVPSGATEEPVKRMRDMLPDIPVIEGSAFRSPGSIAKLRDLELDIFLSVHFPYIIPSEVLELPRIGTFSLQPAYLPDNRGWHTPTWDLEPDAVWRESPLGRRGH